MDLSFVVDSSINMRDNNNPDIDNWQLIIAFMVAAVRFFSVGESGTQVGAVSFGRLNVFRILFASFAAVIIVCTVLLLLLLLLVVVKAMPRHAVTAVCIISSIVCPQLDV